MPLKALAVLSVPYRSPLCSRPTVCSLVAPRSRGTCKALPCPSHSAGLDVLDGCRCKPGYSGEASARGGCWVFVWGKKRGEPKHIQKLSGSFGWEVKVTVCFWKKQRFRSRSSLLLERFFKGKGAKTWLQYLWWSFGKRREALNPEPGVFVGPLSDLFVFFGAGFGVAGVLLLGHLFVFFWGDLLYLWAGFLL